MRVIQFIFSHSIFAALCAVALCAETHLWLGLPQSYSLYAFVFFATLGSYNFHWVMGSYHARGSGFVTATRQHPTAVAFMLLSGLAMLLILPQLWHLAPYIGLAFVATACYTLVLLPVKQMAWLRRAGFMKTLLLALTWTFVTAFLPLQKGFSGLTTAELVFILQRFCLMLQLCLLFDLRDMAVDRIKGLHSLVTDIGPAAAQMMLGILALAYLTVSGILAALMQQLFMGIAFFCVQMAALALYRVPVAKRGYLYYYFLVDGLMLLSALMSGLVYLILKSA